MQAFWLREPRRRRVLVSTSLGLTCAVALRRGEEVAKRLRAQLHLMHAMPKTAHALVRNPSVMREVLRRWAWSEAGIDLQRDQIHIASGTPTPEIERAAVELGADLVVLGSGAGGRCGTAIELCALTSRAVLVTGSEQDGRVIVAATDLEAPGYPVVRAAARVAAALGKSVVVVHNVVPNQPLGERSMQDRMHSLEGLASGFAVVRSARLSMLSSAVDAVEQAAAAQSADLIVVGTRGGRGQTLAGLLERERLRSLLIVPIEAEGP